MFIAAGVTTCMPGQHFLGKPHKNGSEYETNEWIWWRCCRSLKKGGYKPDALKGFKLSKDKEGWKWTRKFKVKHEEEKEVIICEWGAPFDHDSFKGCLLNPKELELINNDEAFMGLMSKWGMSENRWSLQNNAICENYQILVETQGQMYQ